MTPNLRAHKLVRRVAIEFAIELYEQLMRDNARWAKFKSQCPSLTPEKLQREWVRLCWPTMIGAARAKLAESLKSGLTPAQKDEIVTALILDQQLRPGRIRTVLLDDPQAPSVRLQ